MKHRIVVPVLIVFMAALCTPVFGQLTGSVRGLCKDVEGKPIAGAVAEFINADTGRKYDIKTNAKGEYFSLGIEPGTYRVLLLQDGKELFHFNGFHVEIADNNLDFDLQKEAAAAGQGQGLSSEQVKQREEQAAKAAKENNTVKALNEKLLVAKQASDAGNFDAAIATLTEATQMDATRDLLWAKLGEAYLASAPKQSDADEKSKRFGEAAGDFQKAIDLKQKAVDPATPMSPDATKILAQYYNNMGQAMAKSGKTDDAVKAYTQAAQLDPAGAGQYYYNLGAILTNANVTNDPKARQAAVDAFDKAIIADPKRADAYYWKGTNLIGAATLKGDKMIAPDGTAEAFQKYLELQPTGPHAEEAKAMLASIGSTIETEFGKAKKTTKK
jgi:tetratricopeptide (TPR) repeat protein